MQPDDFVLFLLLLVIFLAFIFPIISLPLVIWTRNSRHAKTVQWLAVFLLGVSFLGSLTLAFSGAALAEYSFFGLVLMTANLLALIGILTFKKDSSASRLFLEILSLVFLFAFLLIGGIFVYSQMPEKYKTTKPSSSLSSWQTYTNSDIG